MAVIKHIASKNADYGESERYLIFQHNEYTQKPVLDENGHMILRDEYYLDGLNCDPFTFASECQELNSYYHKNKNPQINWANPSDRNTYCHNTNNCASETGYSIKIF